jgi:hypothetical protein
MLRQKSLGPASDAVFSAMKSVQFTFNGATCTWYGFWFGFGLTASIFLLLSAVIAWQLDCADGASWKLLQPIAWALVVAHVANTALSFAYFFVAPGLFGVAIIVLLAMGSLQKRRLLAPRE